MIAIELIAMFVFISHVVVAWVWGLTFSIRNSGPLRAYVWTILALLFIVIVFSSTRALSESVPVPILVGLWLFAICGSLSFAGIGIWRIHRYLLTKSVFVASLQVISILTFFGFIYVAIFPPASFYIEEFERRTGYELPEDVSVIRKSASYPDFHGDYSSEAVIRLSENDFQLLMDKLRPNDQEHGCMLSPGGAYFGLNYQAQGCWHKKIKSDARIMVTYFPEEFAVHYYFSQT